MLKQDQAASQEYIMDNIVKRSDYLRCGAIVSLSAIRDNLAKLKSLVPGKKILCTVKANAYGHGASEVANAINDSTDVFAVATVDEAVRLRLEGGITKPILILGPSFSFEDDQILRFGITETVFDLDRAKALHENVSRFVAENINSIKELPYIHRDYKAHVHIAVDTGMSRIGLMPDEDGIRTIEAISALSNITIDGIFTHFATADETDKTEALKAYERFRSFKHSLESRGISIPVWHAANTAGILSGIGTDADMDMVRCGIGIYGMYPSADMHPAAATNSAAAEFPPTEVQPDEAGKAGLFPAEAQPDKVGKPESSATEMHPAAGAQLVPAMLWYSYITWVKDIEPGTSVSYGYTFTAEKRTRVATVCCGYADGFPRVRSNKGHVLIGGKKCRIIGNICMDQFMADVTGVDGATVGSPVVLMGSDGENTISPEEIAAEAGTISYEICCGISQRVPRKYV